MRDRRDLLRGCGRQAAVTVGDVAAGVLLLGAPLLAEESAEAIDGSTLSFLLQRALEVKRKEEEAVEAAEGRLLEVLRREREEATRVTRQTWSTLSRVEQLAVMVTRRDKRKKKKKRRTRRSWRRLVDVIFTRPGIWQSLG